MLYSLLSSLKSGVTNDKQPTARKHPRRDVDRCVAVVYGRTFPVVNWSLGGILLQADDRLFGKDQEIEVTLKFKLRSNIVDVNLNGRVVRKNKDRVAIEFEPLGQAIRRQFQQVIDDYVAGEFANSQA